MISIAQRRKRFYGWIVLAGNMLLGFSIAGTVWYSYGVFLPSLIGEFGWSRTALAAPYTVFLIIMGLSGPLVGISVSKIGSRKNMIVGALISIICLTGMSQVRSLWQVYLFYSVLGGASFALTTTVSSMTIVNNWFVRRRSLAMGLRLSAAGVAGFTFIPLISRLISGLGWRSAWLSLAGIQLVLTTVGLILVRNRPEDVGQVPDGIVEGMTEKAGSRKVAPSRVYQTPVEWKAADALRTPALWLMVAFGITSTFTRFILQVHHVAYIGEIGFTAVLASSTLGLQIGISAVGRLLVGFLGTRFEMRHLAAACLAGFLIGVFVLMNARSVPLVYLYTLLVGLSWGGLMVVRPTIIGAYYGRRSYPLVAGYITPLGIAVSSAGPLFAGFIYDTTGSYMIAFIVGAALLGVGIVFALLARPPKSREAF